MLLNLQPPIHFLKNWDGINFTDTRNIEIKKTLCLVMALIIK